MEFFNPYTKASFEAQWKTRNPRVETYNLCRKLENLFHQDLPWSPDFTQQIEEIFDLDTSPSKQIPIRILRGTFIKAVLAVSQQIHVMKCHYPELIDEVVAFSRRLLCDTLIKLESQIYQILDYVEVQNDV